MFAPVFLLCLTSVLYQTSFGFNLTIIHTNDIHAHVEEMNKYAGECKPEESARGQCFGGVARRLTKVNEIRNANPDHTILLDAGDQFQGTLWFNIYKGIEAATFMNKFNYDAMTFGNHEFDNGVSGLLPFLNMSNFPIINCNMDVSNEPDLQGKFNKSIVIEKSGKKIGVIGYLIEETEFLSNPGETVKFNDVKESMRSEITKLKAQGVDIIIGVGHYGYGNDMRLAKEVDGIDVLVGGHTHSFLYKEAGTKGPSVEKSEGPYPTVVTRPDGKPCLVVQVFFAGKYLGRLHVNFDNQGDVTRWSGLPILLDSSVQPGNLITDAMVAYHVKSLGQNGEWTDAAIAVLNSGGIRAPIVQGNITRGDILTVQPFGNNVDIITITGLTLKKMLEHSVAKYSNTDRPGAFLQMSDDSIFEITAKYLSTMDQVMMGDEGRITILTDCSTSSSQRHRASIHFIAVFVTVVTSFNIIMKYS
ncbi:hypothetical protein FSP39_006245 [Pinctada imbricata]|uniref:5'-nucleotidase n=1 Tax=Pinctada imbricata TaxID=66713 RepID=A0AA88Y2F3_PINIB|nr:hypothetical protein FSP39_006245 [Pinctada imbricata]